MLFNYSKNFQNLSLDLYIFLTYLDHHSFLSRLSKLISFLVSPVRGGKGNSIINTNKI